MHSNLLSASLAANEYREIQEMQKMQVFSSLPSFLSFKALPEGLSMSFKAGIFPGK